MNFQKEIFNKKKLVCSTLLLLCNLNPNATNLSYEGGSGKIIDTTTTSFTLHAIEKEYGNRNGTLVLVHNKTLEDLVITDFGNSCGQFYTYPINVPPKQTLAFFHTRKNDGICRSIGKVILQEKKAEIKHAIWWDTFCLDKNTCSSNGVIIRGGNSPLVHFVIDPYNQSVQFYKRLNN